jgi:alanyl-tRNA synthetase
LREGEDVFCKLDFDLRFDRMQNHTGEHILSGLIHRHFGLNNIGFHLGENETTFDFDGVLDRAQLDFIEDLANEAVARNLPITCYYPTPEELGTLTYRAKLDLTEGVRIVHIEEYDDCACCAPHVAHTGEVGLIRMPDFIHYKGGIRIRLLCGRRALLDYRRKDSDLLRIAQRLSVPTEEAEAAVMRLADSELEAKAESAALARALADAKAESIPLGSEDCFCFFEELLGDASMRRLALAGAERTSGLVTVLRGNDKEGYRFCMAGRGRALRSIGVEMTEVLLARCGGSNELISGKIPATKKEILAFFSIDG